MRCESKYQISRRDDEILVEYHVSEASNEEIRYLAPGNPSDTANFIHNFVACRKGSQNYDFLLASCSE